jgi:hypothetical protein
MNATFTKHDDAGHGWLEVQESDIKELGVTVADFSTYSYPSYLIGKDTEVII